MVFKNLLLFMLLLIFLPFAYSADGAVVDETARLWSDVIVGKSLYDANNMTLTLYNPNGSVIVTEYNMTQFSTGLYYYDFVPNVTGNYLGVVEVYNDSGLIGTGTGTVYATQNETTNNMILAITLAIIGLGFLAAYISHNIKLEEIPRGRIAEKALYYALSFIFLVGTPILILTLVENNSSLSYLETFASTSVIVTALVGFVIMLFYIIYHFRKRIERLNDKREEIEDDHTR